MLRSFALAASKLLAPEHEAIEEVRSALDAGWRAAAIELVAGGWRDQVTAAAAVAIAAHATGAPEGGAEDGCATADSLFDAVWRAIDGASWVAPQLVAAASIADPSFEPRAADRLADGMRRAPKTIGALVRAYTRCPARRMPVMAQLGVHDRTMATEEARIGVRGVDGWLDYFAPTSRSS